MTIQQGDQYAIPVKIQMGNTVITPSNCTDVRIKVNDLMLSYENEEITYNSTEQTWAFPLTEDLTFNYGLNVAIQIGVKFDEEYMYSPVQTINVGGSIIKEKWDA